MGLGLRILLVLWVVILFDPHVLLATHGLAVARKILPGLLLVIIMVVMVGVPITPTWRRRWTWHLPLLAFISVGIVTLPFVMNNGIARDWLKEWLLAWVVIVATVAIVNSARRAELLMLMFGASFLWYGLWGAAHGQVVWHTPLFFNPDAFGALMVIGFAFTAYMAVAQGKVWLRRALMFTAALCLVGVVSSFARGAFLAMILVFGVLWLRSDRKLKTLGAGLAGAIVVTGAAALLYGDVFWREMNSVFSQGTTQGTGGDRWVLWSAAWKVFLQKPIFGAGPGNWGVFASTFFSPDELGSRYANPARLYNRSLHNLYMQTLSEMGVVGSAAFVWILVDFWKRNLRLRTRAAQERWSMLGGRMNVRAMALALELSMIAFLVGAAVYDTSGKHWFFTIQGLNLLLYQWAVKEKPKQPVGMSRGRRRHRRIRVGTEQAAPGPAASPGALRASINR